jgi:hypothetical protein
MAWSNVSLHRTPFEGLWLRTAVRLGMVIEDAAGGNKVPTEINMIVIP